MRDFALIIHFLGLVMGMGTPIAFFFLSTAADKMEKEDAVQFRLNSAVITRMGHIGYTLLILSGLYLIIPYWSVIPDEPLLIGKLILVLLLGALIGILSANLRRARKGDPIQYLEKTQKIGPFALLTGLSILVISVLLFH